MKEYVVIRKLVNEGEFEGAIRKAKEVEDKHEKSMIFCMIADAMVYEDKKEEAISLLNEAFEVAKEIEEEFSRSLSMSKIAFIMAIAGNVEEALKMASNIEAPSERIYAMVKISQLLKDVDGIEEARKILEEAERITDEMHDGIWRFISIKTVAYAFVNIGEVDKAWSLIEHAKNMAEKFDEKDASVAHTLIAQFMMELGRLNEAMELINNIREEYDRAWLLSDVAYMKRDIDLLKKAVKIARKMEPRYEKVSVITKIASIMVEWKKKQEADELINKCIKISEDIEYEMEKAMALAVISHTMFENGDERYEDVIGKSIEMAKKLEDFEKEYASPLIARTLIEVGKFKEAMNLINEIENEEMRAEVYISIANDLIEEGREEDAMKIAEFMNDRLLKERIRK
ncbi:MAG TPA: hypothetical protein ENI53_01940 [Thermoplasmatales archaeon]|nr:hypothetical protein [Thermoplasmatales archaeon]